MSGRALVQIALSTRAVDQNTMANKNSPFSKSKGFMETLLRVAFSDRICDSSRKRAFAAHDCDRAQLQSCGHDLAGFSAVRTLLRARQNVDPLLVLCPIIT
jgi:hypothetical protein